MQLVGVSIFLFSAAQPAPPRLVVQTAAYPVSLAASPDGRFLAAEDGGGIRLWDLRSGPRFDTGVVAPVRGLGGTAIVCQSGVAGGMVLRLSQDTLEPLGTIAAGYDVPFASKGVLFFAPTDPAEPVRSLAL